MKSPTIERASIRTGLHAAVRGEYLAVVGCKGNVPANWVVVQGILSECVPVIGRTFGLACSNILDVWYVLVDGSVYACGSFWSCSMRQRGGEKKRRMWLWKRDLHSER